MRNIILLTTLLFSTMLWSQKEYSISNKNPSGWAPLAMGEVDIHTSYTNNATNLNDTTFHISLISTNMPGAWLLGLCSDAQCYTVSPGFSQDCITLKGKSTDLKCTFSFGSTTMIAGTGVARFQFYRTGMMNQADTITFTTLAPATGVNSSSKTVTASISPNPVRNDLSVTLSDNNITSLSILNLVGQEVMVLDYKAGKSFDVSSLPNGIYFLKINKGEASFNKKFIISR